GRRIHPGGVVPLTVRYRSTSYSGSFTRPVSSRYVPWRLYVTELLPPETPTFTAERSPRSRTVSSGSFSIWKTSTVSGTHAVTLLHALRGDLPSTQLLIGQWTREP